MTRTIFCAGLILSSLGFGLPASAQTELGRRVTGIPMPPKAKPADPLNINPATEIPQNPDQFVFQVKHSDAAVSVWTIRDGRRKALGTIPTGTQVSMIGVRVFGKTHYYAIPWSGGSYSPDGGLAGKQMAWINGNYLKPVSYAAGK